MLETQPWLLTLAGLLSDTYPLDGFRDELSKHLQENGDIVLRYAESQGIELPADEESGLEDQIETPSLILENSDLAAALRSSIAASAAVDSEMKEAEAELSKGDSGSSPTASLGLGKLIQESLQKEQDSQPAVPAGGAFESKGLASLIAEKLGQSLGSQPTLSPYPSFTNCTLFVP